MGICSIKITKLVVGYSHWFNAGVCNLFAEGPASQ